MRERIARTKAQERRGRHERLYTHSSGRHGEWMEALGRLEFQHGVGAAKGVARKERPGMCWPEFTDGMDPPFLAARFVCGSWRGAAQTGWWPFLAKVRVGAATSLGEAWGVGLGASVQAGVRWAAIGRLHSGALMLPGDQFGRKTVCKPPAAKAAEPIRQELTVGAF